MEKTSPIDPYIGAEGYFDGTDLSLLLQEEPLKSARERNEIKEIYGDIFGTKHTTPSHSKHPLALSRK